MDIITKIKQKKELQSLSNEFVKQYIQNYKKQNPKLKLTNPRSKNYKLAVKEIRSKIRKVYGLFREDDLIIRQRLMQNLTKKNIINILATHASTRERLPFYKSLYKKIFKITGKPKTILDLGCGINPFSYHFLGSNKIKYYGYDLNEMELGAINIYFAEKKIFGNASILDITRKANLTVLPKADVAFLFKMSAVIDKGKGHKKTENVIDAIPSKYVVVSFPTLTMSGKPMRAPRRKWMEWLCNRREWDYKIIEFKNEIFYVLSKE